MARYAKETNTILVGVVSTFVVGNDPGRETLILMNESDAVVYIAFAEVAVMGEGIRLNAFGASVTFGLSTDIPYTGIVHAITASPDKKLLMMGL